jgi:hypothetical protein
MNVPDYISPIAAHRVWQWDTTGLRSLNGEQWSPGKPLAARCGVVRHGKFVDLPAHVAHIVPKADCRCGVYASKRLDSLRSMCFWDCGVRGEVLLWGTVVEHEHGWRAQFAYPKTLYVPYETLPATLAEIQSRLQSLVPYRCDIFIAHDGGSIPLWRRNSGLDAAGLGFLTGRGKEWYARRKQERTLKCGDRVAILGRGIAVVEQVHGEEVHVVLGNRSMLRIGRKDIVWDEGNRRWEARAQSSVVKDCGST